jgi:prepilin signal peptidase PulO-like enzyme (type II secretory pathway)
MVYSVFDMLTFLQGVIALTIFFLGAAVASFSGFALYRLPKAGEEDTMLGILCYPPSQCERCDHRLGALDLAPVLGWMIFKGKCRSCQTPVNSMYPVAEAITGVASLVIAWAFWPEMVNVGLMLLLFWALIAISAIDWAVHIIPDEITWPLLFIGLLFSPLEADLWSRVAGAALGCGLMWGSLVVTGLLKRQDTTAGGDIALAAVCGAWLGLYALPVQLLLTCAIFAAIAIPRRTKGIEWTPLAPAFALALLVTMPLVPSIPALYGL